MSFTSAKVWILILFSKYFARKVLKRILFVAFYPLFIFTISILTINFIISICYFVAKTLIFKSGLIPNNIIIKIIVKITMKISIISHFALIIHKQILPLSNHKCLYAQAAYAHYNKEAGGIPGGSSRFLIIGIFLMKYLYREINILCHIFLKYQ